MKETREELIQKNLKRQAALKETCSNIYTNTTNDCMLEIGCGHGHFLVAYAQENPKTLCVGIDLLLQRIERGIKKQERAALEQLHFLQADAVEFLNAIPENLTYKEIYILFPDPWPKNRHHKNRLIQEPFLSLLADKISKDGTLYFRTDHDEYFEWTMKLISTHKKWKIIEGTQLPVEEETVFQQRMGRFQTIIAQKA